MEENIQRIPDKRIWQLRTSERNAMIEYARTRLSIDVGSKRLSLPKK